MRQGRAAAGTVSGRKGGIDDAANCRGDCRAGVEGAVYAAGLSRWLAIAVGLGILALADRLGLLRTAAIPV